MDHDLRSGVGGTQLRVEHNHFLDNRCEGYCDAGDPSCAPPPLQGIVDIGAREWLPLPPGGSGG